MASGHRFRLGEEDVLNFRREGVVCLRGVLAVEEIHGLASAIDRATERLWESPSGYDVSSVASAIWEGSSEAVESQNSSQYELDQLAGFVRASGARPLFDAEAEKVGAKGRFLIDTGVCSRDGALRDVALNSVLPEIAAGLLGASKINFYDDQIFVKEPGTKQRTAFHQDNNYFNLTGEMGCVMWAPADRVTRASGGIRYVRGSHLWGRLFKPNIFLSQTPFPGSEGEVLPDIEGHEDEYDIVCFEAEPGDVIVHHFRTVHGGGGNSTATPRRAASLRYCGDDIRFRLRPGAPAQPHHRHRLRDGDPLDCGQFPVVWPRPAGSSAHRQHPLETTF